MVVVLSFFTPKRSPDLTFSHFGVCNVNENWDSLFLPRTLVSPPSPILRLLVLAVSFLMTCKAKLHYGRWFRIA